MRLTFCTFDYPHAIAGPNSWLQTLLPALRAAGDEVRVLIRQAGDLKDCPTVQALHRSGIPTETYPWPTDTRAEVREILGRLVEHPPDVFVPNLIVGGLYAGKFVRGWGIPTVGVVHADDPFYLGGFRERFVQGPADLRLSSVVCVSRFLKETFAQALPGGIHLDEIPCGVPIPVRASEFPEASEPFRVIYTGRLVQEQKRIDEVTRALIHVTIQVAGTRGILYGEGPDRERVCAILADSGTRAVTWGGALSPAEIRNALPSAHAFLMLSDYEGLPVSLMEAMASGAVPICLGIRSGVTELVRDRYNGIFVTDRGPAVVQAIRELKENPELWRELSINARATVAEKYSDTLSTLRWRNLLHTLAPTERKLTLVLPRRIRLPPPHPAMGGPHGDARLRSAPLRALHRVFRKYFMKQKPPQRVQPPPATLEEREFAG